tara:strand:+ start:1177 stop:1359 length:183 start_codon:yes stop_codon:yes gene_type:complete
MAKKGLNMRLKYRLFTGVNDRSFCEKVSRALEEGYVLYGSPTMTFDGQNVIVAQAVILPE